MKAIVTGGAGFIGSHVARILIERGHEVLVIDDLSGGFRENVPRNARFVQASINGNLQPVVDGFQPQYVYHLAAYAAEGLSHHIPSFNYTNNLNGTAKVLAAAYRAGVTHFVFTSSIAAYGHPHSAEPFREDDHSVPADPYGVAKLACEHHIRAFRDYYGGPDFTVFRPHNVYGPGQNISDPFRNVVGIFMARALRGEPLPLFGNGSQTRSFSYVHSVAACIASAPFVAAAKNEIFNVGGDQPTSVRDLAHAIGRVLDVPVQLQFLPERKEVKHAHSSHEKLRRVFEKESEDLPLEDGLQRMAAYVRSHAIPPVTPCPSALEIEDGLPPSWQRWMAAAAPALTASQPGSQAAA